MSSGAANKRALYMGSIGGSPGLDWDVIELEEGVKPYETGFPKQHFDMVIASKVLEKMPLEKILPCVAEWTKILKPGGELTILVPNIAWAACAILAGDMDRWPAIMVTLYGTQETNEEFHHCGFTVQLLRGLIEQMGFKIKEATTIPKLFRCGEEEEELEYVIVKGKKG